MCSHLCLMSEREVVKFLWFESSIGEFDDCRSLALESSFMCGWYRSTPLISPPFKRWRWGRTRWLSRWWIVTRQRRWSWGQRLMIVMNVAETNRAFQSEEHVDIKWWGLNDDSYRFMKQARYRCFIYVPNFDRTFMVYLDYDGRFE